MHSFTIIFYISNITIMFIYMVRNRLESSIRELYMVVSLYMALSISFFFLSKVEMFLGILHFVLVMVRLIAVISMITYVCTICVTCQN